MLVRFFTRPALTQRVLDIQVIEYARDDKIHEIGNLRGAMIESRRRWNHRRTRAGHLREILEMNQ